jgi:hypothetical protein
MKMYAPTLDTLRLPRGLAALTLNAAVVTTSRAKNVVRQIGSLPGRQKR